VTELISTNSNGSSDPWLRPGWAEHSQILLDSYYRWIQRQLIPRTGSLVDQARDLYLAPFVVVSHGTQPDPILNYGNRVALELWEMPIETLLETPSRLTAEPLHRDERARLLERTSRNGFVDDYQGIRISSTGRRFRIDQATVWNLQDATGQYVGQAATFSQWQFLNS
jgi:MEKHLA domain-containing protein